MLTLGGSSVASHRVVSTLKYGWVFKLYYLATLIKKIEAAITASVIVLSTSRGRGVICQSTIYIFKKIARN